MSNLRKESMTMKEEMNLKGYNDMVMAKYDPNSIEEKMKRFKFAKAPTVAKDVNWFQKLNQGTGSKSSSEVKTTKMINGLSE